MAQKKKKTIIYTVNVKASGTRRWYLNKQLHREDGPAVEWFDGDKEWWFKGELHRDGGLPAVEYVDGYKEWWVKGRRHRTDGPAIVYPDGVKKWYLDGWELSRTEFLKRTKKPSCSGKIVIVDGKRYKLTAA